MTPIATHKWETAMIARAYTIRQCVHCGTRLVSSEQGSVLTDGPEVCPFNRDTGERISSTNP